MLIFGSYLNGGKSAARRGSQHCGARYVCSDYRRSHHFPGVLFLSRTAGQRPEADLYDTAAHFHLDEGRTDFRKLFLPVSVLCGTVHYHRCIREHHVLLFRDFRCFRKQSAVINCILILGSLPCALGYNVWSGFQPLGAGSTVLDLEDFIVSNLLFAGQFTLIYLLFCTSKWGWGFQKLPGRGK